MSSRRNGGLGWIKDPRDPRDFAIRRFIRPVTLPPTLDLRPQMWPIRDQGQEGACVGFACGNLKDWQETKESNAQVLVSTRFIYYQGRKLEGRVGEKGMYIRDALKVLQQLGVPPEDLCPYDESLIDVGCETTEVLQKALELRIKSFVRL